MRNSDAAKLALKLGEEKNLKRSEIADWQPLLDYCAGNPLTLRVLVGQAVKAGLRGRERIADFVEAIRSGEQQIEDADEKHGRDKSLGASLNYGFRNAFKEDELPIIALVHLFQGTVYVDVLRAMGVGEHALPDLKGTTKEHLTGLLERAKDTGLLTQIGPAYFTIHPALPWFLRQLFARHYDGQAGRSTSQATLRAWVEAVGGLGGHYWEQVNGGNLGVIHLLELEEANLFHAGRLARRSQWWSTVIASIQGLSMLYRYQGRTAEWARLVEEIRSDYCTDDDEPFAGLEDEYSIVMGYRVLLAEDHEGDLAKAAALQEKVLVVDRQQAAAALALPHGAPLDDEQKNRLRTLSVGVLTLGQIQLEEGSAECLRPYRESLEINKRIGDKPAQAVAEYNLGHAYLNVPGIRDLDASEAAYQRSLKLDNPVDALSISSTIKQIGMVHHERFRVCRERKEPGESLLSHAQAAEKHYLDAVRRCPNDAFTELAPMHGQLGNFYHDIGQRDNAREHYEKAARYFEKVGDRFNAGKTRFNMAVMYAEAARSEGQSSQQRASLRRARAYAEAALSDFHHYQGRAAKDEADAQGLLDKINQALATLPQ